MELIPTIFLVLPVQSVKLFAVYIIRLFYDAISTINII